ncbi:MHYT domain-containing protein [Aliiglaciecola sp. LCG003]|uniref:MHYT domain-containing protein n=1 Tax=Aliiglaciecola sp. LCG003 TaxID=3053655 RepID=UPI0025738475|nr:MHYT domain-containing protein [Aliiglaciecola sp. LCG003]WJG08912.1 MHYT domain-containing protein [Aliiglaciecola sp. LCG003]
MSIAIFASFMGLQVASQASQSTSHRRNQLSLLIGSVALGCGIWSMHFIGMLAFDLCTPVEYALGLTLLSLLPGIAASWVALNYIVHNRKEPLTLLVGGVLVGAGIGTMHYMGMAAMQMGPILRYDLGMFLLSIMVAVGFAVLSLWVRFGLTNLKHHPFSSWQVNGISSLVMGLAISGMHYTGMAAARFARPPGFETSAQTEFTTLYLATGVSIATITIIVLVMGLTLIFKYKDISAKAAEGERRVRAMMDTSIDGIIIINASGKVVTANKATESVLGWSPDEIMGENVNLLMPGPLSAEHDGFLMDYLLTKEAKIIGKGREVEAVHRNGRMVSVRLVIGHLSINRQDYFVGFISDISQRLEMEQAIKDSESKFRSLIGNIPGIAYRCATQPPWPMLFISDAVEEITGYPASDFTLPHPKRSFLDLIHPEDREKAINLSSSNKDFNLEYRIFNREGQTLWMMEYGRHYTDEQNGEVWLDGFIMDITARRAMEEELRLAKDTAEQAASARAAFLANMSHEIRTPMNAIIGFSDILLESHMDEEQCRHLNTIINSAKSLLHLLNDVLDSAKLDKGKLNLEMREFSLIQEVDAVISTLWIQARKKGLDLRSEIPDQLAEDYIGAPDRIRQVLTNLVGNAVKFTQRGYVKVKVRAIDSQHIEFIIEDSGIGMTPEHLDKVFDAFTQADASMSRKFGGTGLGTTISKQLVELMGGKIEVSSEVDKGTVFQFVLPLERATKVKRIAANLSISLPPLTILVVDDIQQNIDLLTLLLRRNGHKVITARDGQQALIRMAAKEPIDIVLMDIQMPIMDGLSATVERRNYEKQHDLSPMPIVALTASVLQEDRAAAENAGMQGFANKPIDFNVLNAEIAKVMGLSLATQQSSESETSVELLLDVDKGVEIWGSREAYFQQVKNLLDAQQDAMAEAVRDCQSSDWQALKAYSHKMRGVCGNLSINLLASHFEKLEVLAGDNNGQCRVVLAAISDCIQTVYSIVKQKTGTSKSSEVEVAIDISKLTDLLQNILTSAEQNEVDETMLSQLLAFKKVSLLHQLK